MAPTERVIAQVDTNDIGGDALAPLRLVLEL